MNETTIERYQPQIATEDDLSPAQLQAHHQLSEAMSRGLLPPMQGNVLLATTGSTLYTFGQGIDDYIDLYVATNGKTHYVVPAALYGSEMLSLAESIKGINESHAELVLHMPTPLPPLLSESIDLDADLEEVESSETA